ncbi:MAG: hypothetical protein Q7U56_03710, partial [Humidesulfovibrio sp.]|nr:hypothetical protein [Humidesulfovibrio sp.]
MSITMTASTPKKQPKSMPRKNAALASPFTEETAMKRSGLLTYAANFAPRLLQVRRTTWIAAGVGLLV